MIHRVYPATALANIGYTLSSSRVGRNSLPVAPYNYIYSHFEHVSGVPASEGIRGVSINKLKILDFLIERLSQLRGKSDLALTAGGTSSPDQIDALIEKYQAQIRQAQAASFAVPYKSVPSAPAGTVFSLVA